MKNRKLLIIAAAALLFIAGCKKSDPADNNNTGTNGTTGTTGSTGSTGVTTSNYAITETFEAGSKTAYADGNVTLNTGSWDFNDALIGNLATDIKDGNWSTRIRTGFIAMNFDINGLTKLVIKHSKYGADATSTWQLLMSKDGGTSYIQVGTDITETSTTLVTDTFKIATTTKIRFKIIKAGTTRINIDDITFIGTGDPGISLGIPDTNGPDTASTKNPTAARGVTIGTDAPPTTGDNSNLLMGNPSGATGTIAMMDNYLINQGYYVESYNATKGEPNWVSWHLDASNRGGTDRLDNFAAYSGLATISSSWYAVQSTSYTGSGFDRGHNCPSADRTSSTDANSATFLMTNMIPQAPQNNQQVWANLENYLRDQVAAGYEVYIIMGSYGTGGTGSLGAATTVNGGHVNVPSNVWKVAVLLPVGNGDLARVSASTRVIAVNTLNNQTVNSDWTQSITTVKAIETATGYTLLSALPSDVQAALKVKVDAGH